MFFRIALPADGGVGLMAAGLWRRMGVVCLLFAVAIVMPSDCQSVVCVRVSFVQDSDTSVVLWLL